MATWWIILISDLLIPIMMLGFGIVMIKRTPKSINYIFGYRTNRSMKNQDTWEYAHKKCGNIWWKTGLIMFVITILAHIPFYNGNENVIGTLATWVMVVQIAALILSIIPTELALKKTFNDDGTRK